MATPERDGDWFTALLCTPSRSPSQRHSLAHTAHSDVDLPLSDTRPPLNLSSFPQSHGSSPFYAHIFTDLANLPLLSSPVFTSSFSMRSSSDSSGSRSQPTDSSSTDTLSGSPVKCMPMSHFQMNASPSPLPSKLSRAPSIPLLSISPLKWGSATPGLDLTPSTSLRRIRTPGTSPVQHSSRPKPRFKHHGVKPSNPPKSKVLSKERSFTVSNDDSEDDLNSEDLLDLGLDLVPRLLDDSSSPPTSSQPLPVSFPPTSSPVQTSSPDRGSSLELLYPDDADKSDYYESGSHSSYVGEDEDYSSPDDHFDHSSVKGFSSPMSPLSSCSSESEDIPLAWSLPKWRRKSVIMSPIRRPRPYKHLLGTKTESPAKRQRLNPNFIPSSPAPAGGLRQYESPVPSDDHALQTSSPDPCRTLPEGVPIHAKFPLYYRRFPICSHTEPQFELQKLSGSTFNSSRGLLDLYIPRYTKGIGRTKVGVCPICAEPKSRGGEGEILWLSMKFSAFKCYHLQYAHGISPTNGLPFSPPTAFRTNPRPGAGPRERKEMIQGRCHKCKKWIDVEGVKEGDAKVKEIYWWKHAAACHRGSNLDGEKDYFVEDSTHLLLVSTQIA